MAVPIWCHRHTGTFRQRDILTQTDYLTDWGKEEFLYSPWDALDIHI